MSISPRKQSFASQSNIKNPLSTPKAMYPVTRSSSFNLHCTVPIKVTASDGKIKSSASCTNCSLFAKLSKTTGLHFPNATTIGGNQSTLVDKKDLCSSLGKLLHKTDHYDLFKKDMINIVSTSIVPLKTTTLNNSTNNKKCVDYFV